LTFSFLDDIIKSTHAIDAKQGWPASDRNTRPASNWNAWPASSVPAVFGNTPESRSAFATKSARIGRSSQVGFFTAQRTLQIYPRLPAKRSASRLRRNASTTKSTKTRVLAGNNVRVA
jgi:hypothetical protein